MLDWEWYKEPNVLTVFIHLLLTANYEDKKWQGILIKRGQLITSYKHLSEQLSGKKGTLSTHQVRLCLKKLKSTGEVASQSTNEYTLMTINNYNRYQDYGKPQPSQTTSGRQADDKRTATTKQYNNINKEREHLLLKDVKEVHGQSTDVIARKPYSKLEDITEEDEKNVALLYKVPRSFVKSSLENLRNHCESKGKSYKNYLSELKIFVKGDKERKGLSDKVFI